MTEHDDQKRYSANDFLEHNGFYYFRICRIGNAPELYSHEAIDEAMQVTQQYRDKQSTKLGAGGDHNRYNVWTNLYRHLRVMKYHIGVTK